MMILETKALRKDYFCGANKLHVLRGINCRIEKGGFAVLLGPSGAGKSTLLHLLGGLDVPTSGEVLLNGVDIYKLKESRRAQLRSRTIGFVFQFYHLLPECTALENVMLPARIAGAGAAGAKRRALDLLAKMGLDKRTAHHPAELSGGEQQRVAIARALVNQPQVLLCDEPTGNLDSKTGMRIFELLRSLNKERNQTIVIATHSQEIARSASRVITIKDGIIVDSADG